jgi:predicted metal-dependent hydrolase
MINTLSFKYTIRRSHRATKTRIVVTTEKIEVVAPMRVSARQIHAFVSMKQDWVVKAQNKLNIEVKAQKKWGAAHYSDGVLVPYQGQQIKLSLQPSSVKKVKIELHEQEFKICFSACSPGQDDSELIRLSLMDWMKAQARKRVTTYVALHAEKYQLYPRLVKIKTQKSRWGSCGIHNDIHINWLLIMAPPEVLEYVVVHELCHIKERNHSTRFWSLVEQHLPEYQKQRLWLRQHGRRLMQGL